MSLNIAPLAKFDDREDNAPPPPKRYMVSVDNMAHSHISAMADELSTTNGHIVEMLLKFYEANL